MVYYICVTGKVIKCDKVKCQWFHTKSENPKRATSWDFLSGLTNCMRYAIIIKRKWFSNHSAEIICRKIFSTHNCLSGKINSYFLSIHIHSAKIMTKIRKTIINVIIISDICMHPLSGGVGIIIEPFPKCYYITQCRKCKCL